MVGGGIMGLSTAWCLSRGGHRVTLVDTGHPLRGSWGESRIARASYHDPPLLRFALRSYELFDELKKATDRPLMYKAGCLDVGIVSYQESLDRLAQTYTKLGTPHERLTRAEVSRRWPVLQLSPQYSDSSVYLRYLFVSFYFLNVFKFLVRIS